jgi:membrane-associated protease RseP (regulator of RpoE activity)
MRRKTKIEIPLVLLLLIIAASIGVNKFRQNASETPPPAAPTATPRVKALALEFETSDALVSSPDSIQPPSSSTAVPPENFAPETGYIVIQVREADGTLPSEPIVLFNESLQFERPIENGRLVLETVTGTLSFQVKTAAGPDQRITPPATVEVTTEDPVELSFTLPAPALEPELLSAGLTLAIADAYLEVSEVEPGSPAARVDIQAGDAIIRINNFPVTDLTPAQIAASLLGTPGTRISILLVIRNAAGAWEEKPVILTLEANE